MALRYDISPPPCFEVTSDSRHVVFLGGPLRESARDLYISDLPVRGHHHSRRGTIALGDGVTLTFPPNAVSTPITVSFTTMPTPGRPLENGRIAVRGFTLEARNGAGQIITQFAQPYTMRASYTDADLTALGVSEAGLNLGFWNGSVWVALLPCAGCSVDTANDTIAVKLNHFTEFSLYGAARRSIFVPLVRR